ncbi:MAG: ABC transporter ATP-binding protein [Candidatus Dormibacteria bacterium]
MTTETVPAAAPGVSSTGEAVVLVRELVKRYPSRPVNAVDGVSFEVRQGEVFGLLGPNGAGKTTTVGILTTRVRPTSGRALVAGVDVVKDPVAARRQLAVVPQRMNIDRSLSARRNLLFHAAYFGMPAKERAARADALLQEFGLADRANDKVDRFSGGQAQRLMLARGLMHDPQVLFLDEPTTGLDPQARLFVWERVGSLRRRGVTVVLTTHDMDEATELADRVAIMDQGKILALDTPQALTALVPGRSTLAISLARQDRAGEPIDALSVVEALQALPGIERGEVVAAAEPGAWSAPGAAGAAAPEGPIRLRLYCAAETTTLIAPVVQALTVAGAELVDMRLGQPSLEDVFIHLTGRGLRG